MHNFELSGSKLVCLDTLYILVNFKFGGHVAIFSPPYWIEVNDVEGWDSIPPPTLSQTTCTPSLRTIEAKLRAWQCRVPFYKMAAMTSTKQMQMIWNWKAINHLHICRTICGKFKKKRSSSLATRQLTDRQTDRHTHSMVRNFIPKRLQYIQSL